MLRGQGMLGKNCLRVFEFLELGKSGLYCALIEFGFECKVIEMCGGAVFFKFDESHHGSKDMVFLSVQQLGG